MRFLEELEWLNIQQIPGMGIFGLDLGAYFPYTNQDILDLDVSLSTDSMERGHVLNLRDQNGVLNHRYPNKGYITLSQKFGRKVCKTGYIIQQPHEEFALFNYINLTYGVGKKQPVRVSVPIELNTSDETPCTAMTIKWDLKDPNEPDLLITIHVKATDDIGWYDFNYGIEAEENERPRYTHLMPENTIEEALQSGFVIFNKTIKIIAQRPENIIVI